MKRPSVAKLMQSACEKHILIPAFNIAYLPMTRPVAETLERLGTFGLAEVAMPDVTRFGAKSFDAVAAEYRKEANPEFVALHLDHIPVIDEEHKRLDWEKLIRKGLDLGFESVMLDGSRLPLEENIAAVRKVVEMCHPKVAVEAELGAVLGHEAGPIPPYEELFRSKKGFTDPEEARRFVTETGVDWLSVAIGNIHGAISAAAKGKQKVAARLSLEQLDRIHNATDIPLVLHGGTGIRKEYILRAIEHGIAKINVATAIRQPYERHIEKGIASAQAAVYEAMLSVIREDLDAQDSATVLEPEE